MSAISNLSNSVVAPSRQTQRQTWLAAALRLLGWAAVLVPALFFLIFAALRYFNVSSKTYGPYWPHWGWMLLHVSGGVAALLPGIFQLWSGGRKRYFRIHRWMGRLYLAGVCAVVGGAFYFSFHSAIGWMFGVSLFTLAFACAVCTIMAFISIRNGQIKSHKEWMTRSYVLIFAFVTSRILLHSPLFVGWGNRHERFATIAWLSWVVPLFLTEVALQWKRSVTPAVR